MEVLADGGGPLTIAQLTAVLGVHRSIVYRILRTLEDHRLVGRTPDGSFVPGVGLSTLARSVSRDLQNAALPELAAVANEVRMTCFVVVPDGQDCVTLASVEPRHSVASVVQRPGTRHPLDRGAPGLALLATRPPTDGERTELADVRREGYARSHDEVIPGLSSLAVPISSANRSTLAAVALVYLGSEVDAAALAHRLQRAAAIIGADLP
jgi:DNA-binding IclR family transcriptional regulator